MASWWDGSPKEFCHLCKEVDGWSGLSKNIWEELIERLSLGLVISYHGSNN